MFLFLSAFGFGIAFCAPPGAVTALALRRGLEKGFGAALPDPKELLVFFAGFMLGSLLWCFFMAGLIAWGRRFITPLFFRLVHLICSLALVLFAIKLLWNTIMLLKGQ